MKTITWAWFTLAFIVVNTTYATEFPKMNVVPVKGEKAKLVFESTSPCPIEITISNDQNEVVYFIQSKKRISEYSRIFDLAAFKNGVYKACLNYGNRSISREFLVVGDKVKVGPPKRCYEPYYKYENGKLNISFLNVSCKKVHLKVFKQGEFIGGINLGNDLCIQKRMDLTGLEKGKYDLVLSEKLNQHNYSLEI